MFNAFFVIHFKLPGLSHHESEVNGISYILYLFY